MQRLAEAAQAYQARDYVRAAALCRQIAQADPFHADALSLLGFANLALGNASDAAAACQQALRAQPDHFDAHHALGIALGAQRRWAEAEVCFRFVVQQRPDLSDGYNNLGITLREQGRYQEAEACYRQGLQLNPNSAELFSNLANALKDQGKLAEAEATFRRGPRPTEISRETHHNPGFFAEAQAAFHARNYTRALELCRQALEREPRQSQCLSLLGFIYLALNRPAEAIDACRRAIEADADNFDAYNALGVALASERQWPEAEESFRRVVFLNPDLADAYNNLGITLKEQGKHEDADGAFRRAIALKPDHAGAHYNLGMHLLLRGDFDQGWDEYEWRWPVLHGVPVGGPPFAQAVWDGSPLNGRTILLYTEQGLGDTIQFLRYVSVVRARGGRVVVEVHQALADLLEGSGEIDQAVPKGASRPAFDVQASLMSLPRILKSRIDTIPGTVPYLSVDPRRAAYWREELAALGGFKVGIVWQGSPKHRNDRVRSVPLAEFAPLAEIDGVRLIALQNGAGREQLPGFAAMHPILDWGSRIEASARPLVEAAAILKGLDLLISVDTAPAHLAGAVGAPVWLAVPFTPDWRWLLERDDSPWYPTMRLFRQSRPGDWRGVFARLTRAVAEAAARPADPAS
jgi:tetratricopeptide (TPR) repeat protein